MITLIIIIHVLACVALITIVLIQRGRGGGLVESFSGVESMFGTKTTAFLTRSTTVLSVVFFTTCLTLAVLSARQSRSLMRDVKHEEAAVTQEEVSGVSQEAASKTAAPEAAQPQEATQEAIPNTQ